jgi:hypothetical protein
MGTQLTDGDYIAMLRHMERTERAVREAQAGVTELRGLVTVLRAEVDTLRQRVDGESVSDPL